MFKDRMKLNMAKVLQVIYLVIFLTSAGLMVVMHIIPDPALAVFRIPKELREVCPSLALGWPKSLEVYHVFLLSFFAVIILNGIGLYRIHIPKWRSICKTSSFFGLVLIGLIFIFFELPFGLRNNCDSNHLQTAFIYSSFLFGFFIIDLLTFFVAQKEVKYPLRP